MDADNAAKCNQGWKMFDTRRGFIKCRPREEREDRMTRILMCNERYGLIQGRQIYLNNNSLVEYPFCPAGRILAVAYISSQRKLVMSSQYPKQLFFKPINSKEKTIIKTEYLIFAIAIDDHKQLVFMKVSKPERVCVMSRDGKNFKTLFSLVKVCPVPPEYELIADNKRSLIYIVCRMGNFLQFTYQGVSKGKIGDDASGVVFCLDTQGNVLYYQDSNHYFKMFSLSDHTITTIHTLKVVRLHSLLNVGSILYLQPYKEDYLLVVNMKDMDTTIKINIDYRGLPKMCLIP